MNSRQAITDFLFISDNPEPVDFAFVLGTPSLASIDPAISLYQQGFTKRIVISGLGPEKTLDNRHVPEAEVLKNYAVNCGIPETDILLEIKATNTLENFSFSRSLIEQSFGWDNIASVAICGKPFHMRRALMTARAQWPGHLRLLMVPSNYPEDPNSETWWQTSAGKSFIFKELNAISIYAMKGDIGDF